MQTAPTLAASFTNSDCMSGSVSCMSGSVLWSLQPLLLPVRVHSLLENRSSKKFAAKNLLCGVVDLAGFNQCDDCGTRRVFFESYNFHEIFSSYFFFEVFASLPNPTDVMFQ